MLGFGLFTKKTKFLLKVTKKAKKVLTKVSGDGIMHKTFDSPPPKKGKEVR